MSNPIPAGPFSQVSASDGSQVPYYIIPYDKHGACIGPQTRQHLLDSIASGDFSDVFVFSHGWNNDWSAATKRYSEFMDGYIKMRQTHSLPMPAHYKPLMIGIYWPSTALVFFDDEVGPAMAAGDAANAHVAQSLEVIHQLADELPAEDAERFYELMQHSEFSQDEALELATIVKPLYAVDDELHDDVSLDATEIVAMWAAASTLEPTEEELDTVTLADGIEVADPSAAGLGNLLKKLDPRNILRVLTVQQMKDRAGTVGGRGVHQLLVDVLKNAGPRVHLLGHSYGAKVMLSATCNGVLPRSVTSMLLLQPAVSHLCFAHQVPGTERAGGYHVAPERVEKPILSTFSDKDKPLRLTFHLALRRKSDLGEGKIATGGQPPSRFAALGGYGPRGSDEQLIDIHSVNEAYILQSDVPIYGLRGDAAISSHGDISNEATWWALYSLVSAD